MDNATTIAIKNMPTQMRFITMKLISDFNEDELFLRQESFKKADFFLVCLIKKFAQSDKGVQNFLVLCGRSFQKFQDGIERHISADFHVAWPR